MQPAGTRSWPRLYYGAKHIDAVELNPVTVHLVTTVYANFDGHLAQNPAVSYINADGRSFMARTDKHYNLIWYPAPDSYAASSGALSSAYVLSESYLYTTNGLQSMLAAPERQRRVRGPIRRGRCHLRSPNLALRSHCPPGTGQPRHHRSFGPHHGGSHAYAGFRHPVVHDPGQQECLHCGRPPSIPGRGQGSPETRRCSLPAGRP